ncbi:MAG: hypothetical protein R3A46_13720 [Thermomicrobiales bacterium]
MTRIPRWGQFAVLAIAMLVAGALIGLAIAAWTDDASDSEPDVVGEATSSAPLDVSMNGRLLGDANAPVKVVEWGNYK